MADSPHRVTVELLQIFAHGTYEQYLGEQVLEREKRLCSTEAVYSLLIVEFQRAPPSSRRCLNRRGKS